jgi:hypothetical protein
MVECRAPVFDLLKFETSWAFPGRAGPNKGSRRERSPSLAGRSPLGDRIFGGESVETIFDWVTVIIFGGMIVLFLHRSTTDGPPRDNILQYLPPALGCAVANYFGNQGQVQLAAAIVFAVLAYIAFVLKPFDLKF